MIGSFLKYLNYEKRYSQHTLNAYQTDLEQFQEFLELNFPEINLVKATHRSIRTWIISLVEAQLDARTVNRKIATLRSFYKFLLKREEISIDPTTKIKVLKTSKKLPHFVNENDMTKMLDNIDFSDDLEGTRDQLILELLYGTGVRLTELLNIQDQDIDEYQHTIRVLGKRNKERVIPFPKTLLAVIHSYKNWRSSEVANREGEFLLVTDSGKQCYPMFVYRVVKKYLETIGSLDKRSPHVLRHTFATHLLNKGAELNAVKDLLGHAGLAATQVYTHNTLEKLKNVYDQAHPKA